MKEQALEFLKDQFFCVISTASLQGKPEAAFVAFSENEKLEIMIGTSTKSRKYKNIVENPQVAIVFGLDGTKTLQYQGKARVLSDEEEAQRIVAHYQKQPSAKKFDVDDSNIYFLVKPEWLRIATSSTNVLGELKEFS